VDDNDRAPVGDEVSHVADRTGGIDRL
jgi:hypothetical protein